MSLAEQIKAQGSLQNKPIEIDFKEFENMWKKSSDDLLILFNQLAQARWHRLKLKLTHKKDAPLLVSKILSWTTGSRGYKIYKRLPEEIQEIIEQQLDIHINARSYYDDTIKLLKCATNEWRLYCAPRYDDYAVDSPWLGDDQIGTIRGLYSFHSCVINQSWCNCKCVGKWLSYSSPNYQAQIGMRSSPGSASAPVAPLGCREVRYNDIRCDGINLPRRNPGKNCDCHLIHNSRIIKDSKDHEYEDIQTLPTKPYHKPDPRIAIAIYKCKAAAILRYKKTIETYPYYIGDSECTIYYLGEGGKTCHDTFAEALNQWA